MSPCCRQRTPNLLLRSLRTALAIACFIAAPSVSARDANAQLVASADYANLYVATLPLIDLRRSLPDTVYAMPEAQGVYVRLVWSVIEPSRGRYDWSLLDNEIDRALKANKKISLSVIAGGYAPEWLWRDGVRHSTFVIGQGGGANRRCRNLQIGWPWDSRYQDAFLAMMRALQQHLRSRPEAYQAVKIVKLTGINQITEELRLPAGDGTQRGIPDPCLSDATRIWREAGYQPNLVVQAWNRIADGINEIFPDKLLATDILDNNDFPRLGETGQPAVKDSILQNGVSRFPGRYAVQWNGLSAERSSPVVLAAGRAGAVMGWQTNAFRGLQGAGCNALRAESPQPCDEQRYQAILDHGIAIGGRYIEIWPADALAFRGAVAKAAGRLREATR